MLENINNGKAYSKFLELVKKQNGDISYIENPEKFEKAKYVMPVIADISGYVNKLNAEKVGVTSVHLGAGRVKKEDGIDYSVGIWLEKKISDKVEAGEVLAYIHSSDEEKGKQAVEDIKQAYEIVQNPVEEQEYILDII